MASIMRLTMTEKVIANKNIDIRESFFGLVKRAYYLPTESKIVVSLKDLDVETGNKVKKLLDDQNENLKENVAALGEVRESPISNMRLEVCVSRDGQFAAFQLLRFMGIDYRPITDVRIYEGAEAELVASALSNTN
ncbi:MAG: hypothetical protein ACI4AH_03125 [Muribaculaceae bacterium]